MFYDAALPYSVTMRWYSCPIRGEEMMKSALDRLQAIGMFQMNHDLIAQMVTDI